MRSSKPRTRRHFLAESAALAAVAATPWRVAAADAPDRADAFVADVVREVVKATPGGNVVLSPVSLQASLALAAMGARGETRDRLQAALGLSGLDPEAIRARFASVMLETHRAVFVRDVAIDPAYAQAAADGLQADVRRLPADSQVAVQMINDWADESTHHRIRRVMDSLDPSTRLVLADAVFLKFDWLHSFKPAETRDEPFHRHAGDSIRVPMMSMILDTTAGACSVGLFVHLKFAGAGDGVDLVLPRAGLSAEDALDRVLRSPQELVPGPRWHEYYREVHLKLPRLMLKSSNALSHALAHTGIGALCEHADLAGISPELSEGMLGEIQQQAWMKVDEQGVEAAAVTSSVVITGAAIPADPPLELVFDRPFALVIRDRNVLFAAVVRDPSITT